MKKILQKTLIICTLFSAKGFTSEKAVKEFEEDWKNSSYTQIVLDPIDINHVLKASYTTGQPLRFTRQMLWDVERCKAWDPKTYIPHVVKEGHSWGRENLRDGDERFMRWSSQKQWVRDEYGIVIEEVHLLNKHQKVIFIGKSTSEDENRNLIQATDTQPPFHVEHGVGGSEECPLNTWRIVHLTTEKDENLTKRFDDFKNQKYLPSYVEIYIKEVLGISLKRK